MALRVLLFALLAAAVIQTGAEALAGGPVLPMALAPFLPDRLRPGMTMALSMVLLAALILPAAFHKGRAARAGAALAAGGLGLNALVQAGASVLAGTLVPGTLAGLVMMLPAALAVLWALGREGWPMAVLGAALSPAVLLALWHLAALLP